MSHWVRIALVSECPPGQAFERVADERVIALVNVEGTYFALDGVCPHQGGPLGQGALDGPVLTCPWHGWQFNVVDGCNLLNPRIVQSTYEVRVEDEWILVNLG